MSLLANSNAIEDAGYKIQRSLRFRSSASAYLNRTPSVAGNRTTWTYSAWLKIGALGVAGSGRAILRCYNGTTDSTWSEIRLGVNNAGYYDSIALGGYATNWRITNAQFRDPSAWYHIVVVWDTTNATAANRVRIYVNGVQQTSFQTSNDPALNATSGINQSAAHVIGSGLSQFYDGYLAEVNFIDGQALTPSSFGQTDPVTGVWTPKKYTGTYGTNGFYLPFTDNSSPTTLGYDKSGNGNNWTANNISTTAGATYDSMTDVPTLTSATAANYCVLNPLNTYAATISNANLNVTFTDGSSSRTTFSTMGVSSGKWYWETTVTSTALTYYPGIGVNTNLAALPTNQSGSDSTGYMYLVTGQKLNNNSLASYGASYTTNDVIGVALDMDGGTITFYKNNASQGQAYSGITGTAVPCFIGSGGSCAANFGQRPFSYTPPTGFKALNTFNLPDPTIKKPNQYMDATLYTGNGSTQTITNAGGFQPNLVWIKARSNAGNHSIFDTSRGINNVLSSNLTSAQDATPTDSLTAFNSNGFSVGANLTGTIPYVNQNTQTYVGWQWKKGATPGFDIVTGQYTATAPASQSFSHSLGVTPSMIIVKDRTGASSWGVWHKAYGSYSGNTNILFLNSTAAISSGNYMGTINSTVFSVASGLVAQNNNFVAYLFAEIPGFSKFGSYTGNGSADGPFVYCGFRPAFVIIKRTDGAGSWSMYDAKRNPFNQVGQSLFANVSDAEYTNLSGYIHDFLSNGFKPRQSNGDNNSGATYIYAAFAENPFKYSLAR